MEITLEKIDSLRERANVSYAEAKAALEANNGNMIDAIIYLESENKTVNDRAKKAHERAKERQRHHDRKEQVRNNADDFVTGFKKVLKSLNETRMVMYNDDRVILDVSLTITIIAAVFAFPILMTIFVIGLLTGNRYKIIRKDRKTDTVNTVLDKAAEFSQTVTDTLKEKVKDVQDKEEE